MPWTWLVNDFHIGVWTFLLAGLIHLGLCALLLRLDFPNPLHRAAGLYLFLVGVADVVRIVEGPRWAQSLSTLGAYCAVAATFALFYVAACYHDRFGAGRTRQRALPLLLIVGALALLCVLLRWPGWAFVGQRPWFGTIIVALQMGGLALLSALFLARATAAGLSRVQSRQLMLAGFAFVFFPLAYGPHTMLRPMMPVPDYYTAIMLLATLPSGYVVAKAVHLARTPGRLQPTARAGLLLLAIALSTFAVLATINWLLIQGALSLTAARRTMLVFMGFWPTVTACIHTYVILRGEIFGVPARLKWTIHKGTVAGALLAVFFVVAQLAEVVIGRLFGGSQWVLGGVGAGLALFALTPLQQMAGKVADAAMPNVKRVGQMTSSERRAAFRDQLEAAWSDGAINAKERRMLEAARNALGISHEEAAGMEANLLDAHAPGPRKAVNPPASA